MLTRFHVIGTQAGAEPSQVQILLNQTPMGGARRKILDFLMTVDGVEVVEMIWGKSAILVTSILPDVLPPQPYFRHYLRVKLSEFLGHSLPVQSFRRITKWQSLGDASVWTVELSCVVDALLAEQLNAPGSPLELLNWQGSVIEVNPQMLPEHELPVYITRAAQISHPQGQPPLNLLVLRNNDDAASGNPSVRILSSRRYPATLALQLQADERVLGVEFFANMHGVRTTVSDSSCVPSVAEMAQEAIRKNCS